MSSVFWDHTVNGSALFVSIQELVRRHTLARRLPQPQPRMGKSWRIKVGGIRYSEMWLRRYAQLRNMHGCVVMASDWANRMTNENRPIVRDLDTDLELLLAHAKLQQRTREVVTRKGSNVDS